MGSILSKSPSKYEELDLKFRDEFSDIFSSLHHDCQIAAGACYYSAERHESIARFMEVISSAFGVLSAGGFGVMHFYKGGLTLKGKGILGGSSTVLAACFALSSMLGGIRNSTRSPGMLSQTYNEAAAEWDELQHVLEVYKRVKVRDPHVNLSEMEMMCREILRRRKEIGLRAKVEEWAYRKVLKEEELFLIEPKAENNKEKENADILKAKEKS